MPLSPLQLTGVAEGLIPDWPPVPGVRALQTTRIGGQSRGDWAGLNLGDHVGDDPAAVAANRAQLRNLLPAAPFWLKQVHGVRVVDLDRAPVNAEADAALSRACQQICVVMTADCLPVLFAAKDGSVVAAAHAGWRGLCDGVLEATFGALQCQPSDVQIWLGPAIGPQAFEVGPEVQAAFVAHDPRAADAFRAGRGDRWYGDIFALARQRLQALGITAIYGGGVCTVSDPQRFFSHRRDGRSGRMATLIWREPSA